MTNWTISVWNKDANNTRTGLEHDELAKHMFVYKKTDLEAVFLEMQALWKIIFDFVGYLRRPLQPSIAETADEIFLRLCNEPRICLALEQLRNPKKKSMISAKAASAKAAADTALVRSPACPGLSIS